MENINDQEPTPEDDMTPDESGDGIDAPGADDATLSGDSDLPQGNDIDTDTAEIRFEEAATDDTEPIEDAPPDDEPVYAQTAANPPPPVGHVMPNRLTRDPHATFGGVLSGIAHRYGWDVALTRLAFVLALVATGGTAILVYFLAWLIIPRATHWPPATMARGNGVSGRELGIGLVALGALIVLGISTGEAAAVLVPLALVGGGIWLLVQNPRTEVAVGTPAGTSYPVGGAEPAQYVAHAAAPAAPPLMQPVVQQEVPPRSRLRRFGIVGLIGLFGLFLLSLIAIPILLFAAVFGGDFNVEFNEDPIFVTPTEIEDIPRAISEDAGEIIVDLRDVDFSSIGVDDDPVELDVSLDAGRIEVRLPDDLRVNVDAESDLVGQVNVLGRSDDGLSPELSVDVDDPQLVLDLQVNAGEIDVFDSTERRSIIVEVD